MCTPMKVLIGYDGSSHSDIVLEDLQRAGLPATLNAVVLTVADALIIAEDGERRWAAGYKGQISAQDACALATNLLQEASTIAHAGCCRLQAIFPNWNIQGQVSAGLPAWDLFWKSAELHPDLVVVGSSNRSGLCNFLLGSVAQTVLTQAFCSVRVARKHGSDPQRPLRLLVGIDGSRGAEEAVRVVAQRAWPAESQIRLVMGLEPGQFATIDLTRLLHETLLKDLDKNTLLHAEQVAQAATEMIALHNPQLTISKLVKVGKPENVLLEEAERWGAHCIFLGAHGDHWSVRQMLGSVVSTVARYAKCSVEVVRRRR